MKQEFNMVLYNINDNNNIDENKLEIKTNQINFLDLMTTYIVSEYDENCEEHFKINEIIPIN